MKQEHSNHILLASIAGLLIASTGILYYKENIKADSMPVQNIKNPLDELSIEKTYTSLYHLIASRSVSTLVQMLQGLSIERTIAIVHMIISSKNSALTREDKAQIIFGLVHNNSILKKQYQLLDILKQFRDLKKDKPILVSAVHSQYASIIPVILTWMKGRKLDDISIKNAFEYTIMHNDVTGFTALIKYGVPVTKMQANALLFKTVTFNKMAEFIAPLIDLGADIDTVSDGKTALMQAVLHNNIAMVETILKSGGSKNINKVVDPKIGSALQLAIEKNYTNIDILLREYGARE